MRLAKLLGLVLLCAGSVLAQGGNLGSNATPTVNQFGVPVPSAHIAVCRGMATTAASVSGNTVTLTMSSNPTTAGFTVGSTIIVADFTGSDFYLNGSYTATAIGSSTIQYFLVHANATASTNGDVVQQGNTTTACLPLASIYQDPALSTSASNPFQSDGSGNWNIYAAPGNYQVQFYATSLITTIKPITVDCAPNSTSSCAGALASNNTWTGNNTFTGNFQSKGLLDNGTITASEPVVVPSLNKIVYVDCNVYSCSPDIGTGINAAIAALPSSGGEIHLPSGTYSDALGTIIVNKPVRIVCPNRAATIINFTRSSGVAVLFNYATTGSGDYRDWGSGLYNCQLIGPGGYTGGVSSTGTAIQIGDATHASEGTVLQNDYVSGFNLGLTWANSAAWGTKCDHSSFVNNNQHVLYNLTNTIENIFFNHCIFGADQYTTGMLANAIQLGGTNGGDFNFIAPSFDGAQLVVSAGSVKTIDAHYENPGGNTTSDYVDVTGGQVSETNPDFRQDSSSGSVPTQFIHVTGGYYSTVAPYYFTNSTMANILTGASPGAFNVAFVRGTFGTFTTSYNPVSGNYMVVGDQLGNANFGGPSTTINSPAINLNGKGNNVPIVTSFTTTAATSDNVTVTGMTASGHCALQPTNATADTLLTGEYVSAKTTNQITVTHAATSGGTFDVMCTPN